MDGIPSLWSGLDTLTRRPALVPALPFPAVRAQQLSALGPRLAVLLCRSQFPPSLHSPSQKVGEKTREAGLRLRLVPVLRVVGSETGHSAHWPLLVSRHFTGSGSQPPHAALKG